MALETDIATIRSYIEDGSPRYMAELLARMYEVVAIPDATAYQCLEANSHKLHIVPNLTADCTITLPAAAEGMRFTFITKAGAADAQNLLIDTGPTANFFIGGVLWLDNDSATDNVAAVFSDGSDDDLLTIVTPDGGTRVSVYCDGTNWIFTESIIVSATTPTIG